MILCFAHVSMDCPISLVMELFEGVRQIRNSLARPLIIRYPQLMSFLQSLAGILSSIFHFSTSVLIFRFRFCVFVSLEILLVHWRAKNRRSCPVGSDQISQH